MSDRTLVAYFSKGGATEAYARIVGNVLSDRGFQVDVVNLRRDPAPDLDRYRNVVVGTGVRIGMVYRRGKKFLRQAALRDKRLAIFISSGIAVDQPDESRSRFLTPLVRTCGLSPVKYDAFPGILPGPRGKMEDRSDPDLARRWAEDLAERLKAAVTEEGARARAAIGAAPGYRSTG